MSDYGTVKIIETGLDLTESKKSNIDWFVFYGSQCSLSMNNF